ncbi:MAG: aspartate aminotransferase family protein [Myxococcota bacterium]|nr:aspartate aminotransferase family protein [Myxococcota bacterium]
MLHHRTLPPALLDDVPGPRSRALAARLARVESRNVTCLAPEPPIFWERAAGANVWDADGNRFVDLGAGFGVASAGHAHPRIVAAIAEQSATLLHAMGDVHPAVVKVELLERLTALFPGAGPARAVLGSSGSDAVEAALETALLATGHAGVLAFEGAYHGLSLGALDTTWRPEFRDPFAARLPGTTVFARFGDLADVERVACRAPHAIGAVLVEPIQGRGGERIPPAGFLRALRALCDREGWLLLADEIYTGLGRTGRTWAVDHEDVVPDLLCAGKGLAGGMPLSACIGRAGVMDAWPESTGESLHTQTFLGHPRLRGGDRRPGRARGGTARRAGGGPRRARARAPARAPRTGLRRQTRARRAWTRPADRHRMRRGRPGTGRLAGRAAPRRHRDPLRRSRGGAVGHAGAEHRGRGAAGGARRARREHRRVTPNAEATEHHGAQGPDPARAALDARVLAWLREPLSAQDAAPPDDERFDELARTLFGFQFEHCVPYRRFCEARGRTPANLQRWSEIPAIPAAAFKELPLRSFSRERICRVFRTSGTTATQRGALALDTLEALRSLAAAELPARGVAGSRTRRPRPAADPRAGARRRAGFLAVPHVRRRAAGTR